jgi:hypothetical protein
VIESNQSIKYVIAPDRPRTSGGTPSPEENSSNPNKKSRFTRSQKMTAAIVTGLVAVGAGVIGIGAASNAGNDKTPPKGVETTKVETPKVEPSKTPEAAPAYETVVIPVDATAQEIGEAIVKIGNAQYDGNLTKATYDAILADNTGATPMELARAIATKDVKTIMDAQYIPNWQNDAHLPTVYNTLVDGNAARIFNYTSGQSLKETTTLDAVSEIPSITSSRIINIVTTDHYDDPSDPANTAKNDGHKGYEQVTLVPLNGRLVISEQAFGVS